MTYLRTRRNRHNRPSMKVGDTFTSKCHGDYEVIGYASREGVTIRFADTGNEYYTTAQAIEQNTVKDKKLCNK